MTHQSDSEAQRSAEPLILSAIGEQLGVDLAPRSMGVGEAAKVDVDGVASDDSVFVEIFARQGKLKGGQFHKVARDALKLITLSREHPDALLVIAFGDHQAAACVTGKSWLAEALRTWGVKVLVADLEPDVREGIRVAQVRQVMVNPELS